MDNLTILINIFPRTLHIKLLISYADNFGQECGSIIIQNPSIVKIGPVVLKKILKFCQLRYFHYFVIISPWKRAWPFIWTKLNPHHPRMLCAKFGWNWLSGSREEDENVKSLRQLQRRRTTYKLCSEKLIIAFVSGELKMKLTALSKWIMMIKCCILCKKYRVRYSYFLLVYAYAYAWKKERDE